jgi:hypothetical protein
VAAGESVGGPIDYMVSSAGQFGTVDLGTGAFTSIGVADLSELEDITRIPGGPLYAMDNSSDLRTINVSDGTTTVIGVSGNGILGLKEDPTNGTLYGFTKTDLYAINPTTAAATHVGAFGVTLSGAFDGAFDSSGHFFVEGSSTLYSVDKSTALATLIGTVSGFSLQAMDFENGLLYASTSNTGGPIITVDPTTAIGKLVADQDAAIKGTIFAMATASNPTTTSAIPEPTTLILFGIGIVGLLGCRARWGRKLIA